MRRLWQICWCPPKGICQAGKDMNIMPLSDKKSFNLMKQENRFCQDQIIS